MKSIVYVVCLALFPSISFAQNDTISTNIYQKNGNLGIGIVSPTHLLSISGEPEYNKKEELARFSLKNDSKSNLIVGNSTTSNSFYVPSIKGFTIMPKQPGLVLRGITSSDNDNSGDALVHITPYILNGEMLLYPKKRHYLGIQGYETGIGEKSLFEIDEKGFVGIGTDDPTSKLHISDGDIFIADINKGIIMRSPDGNCWRGVLDNSGNLNFSLVDTLEQRIVSKSSSLESLDLVTIYPNPSNEVITISLDESLNKKFVYTITSLSGRLLDKGKIKSNKQSVDLTRFVSGVYVLNIYDKNGDIIASEKIIKK